MALLLRKVAGCVLGWARFALRMLSSTVATKSRGLLAIGLYIKLIIGFLLLRFILVFASNSMKRGTDFCLHCCKLCFNCF